MDKPICLLDMDGTIADLYHYPDRCGIITNHSKDPWTEGSQNANAKACARMFSSLNPMISAEELGGYLRDHFSRTIVCTMTPWQAPDDVCMEVASAKIEWLHKHYPFLQEYIVLQYQESKNDIDSGLVRSSMLTGLPLGWQPDAKTVLIDDSAKLRHNFVGAALVPYWLDRFEPNL